MVIAEGGDIVLGGDGAAIPMAVVQVPQHHAGVAAALFGGPAEPLQAHGEILG